MGAGQVTLNIPPFRGMVRTLIFINVGVFIAQSLLMLIDHDLADASVYYLALTPYILVHKYYVWQLVTYAFLHAGVSHIFFNMLVLWMFGSTMEGYWGSRHFTFFFFACAIGGALLNVGMGMMHYFGAGRFPTVGESGAGMGIMVAYALTFGNNMIYVLPLPFPIKAKYLVAVFFAMDVLGAIRGEGGGVAYFVHIGGAVTAYFLVRYGSRRRSGYDYSMSERYYQSRNILSNWFTRWKRRQAAKKFEVYMREIDREKHFDEKGNLRDPNDGNGKGGPGSWVN